jgi:hypothetical protein
MAKLDRDAEWANRARVGVDEKIATTVLSDVARAQVAAALDSAVGNIGTFEWRDGMKPWFPQMAGSPVRPTQSELDELGAWYFARPGVNIPRAAAPDARH